MFGFLKDKAYNVHWINFEYDDIVFQIEKRPAGGRSTRRVMMDNDLVTEFSEDVMVTWDANVRGSTRKYIYRSGIDIGEPKHMVFEIKNGKMDRIFPSERAKEGVL